MYFESALHAALYLIIAFIDIVGVIIVLWGTLLAAIGLVRMKLGEDSGEGFVTGTAKIRATFGTYILLGLEFMIASDIINTFARPTTQDVLTLAIIVGIRTAISYFLEREVKALRQDAVSGKVK